MSTKKQPKEYAWEPHVGGSEHWYVRVEDGTNCGHVEKRGGRWMSFERGQKGHRGVSVHQTLEYAKRACERAWARL